MPEKGKAETSRRDEVELENQFILRMPEEPAKVLREAIKEGANNLKERLAIRLDNDLRYGEVRFDQYHLHAKVVDLPTIIESLKSVDLKSFYKTADICQMMICKTEPEPIQEEESPNKGKKKDPNKVDKKFLWPHGVTPPLKNVRKRRFRKTLKKKYVEAPEIEKEVKRLLRVDNEAVKVSWEIIEEEADPNKPPQKSEDDIPTSSKQKHSKHRNSTTDDGETQGTSRDVAEHDIFGAEVSDSDEEESNLKMIELDETSRLSADDSRSRLSDSNSMHFQGTSEKMATEFSQSMFNSSADSLIHMQQGVELYDRSEPDNDFDNPSLSQDSRDVNIKIEELEQELKELKAQRIQKELEISSIENQTLRKRLQDNLDSLSNQINDKELEMHRLQSILF